MPVYKQHTVIEIARNLKAFLRLDLGLIRGDLPDLAGKRNQASEALLRSKLDAAHAELRRKERELKAARMPRPEKIADGVEPENMVWIFGTGRSGSTWLRTMMSEMKDHAVWEEPMVGLLFGGFHRNAQEGQLASKKFILGEPTRVGWTISIRNFVLEGVRLANPSLKSGEYLVIKEPNGSAGAPLLMEALPESRMIFLVRDPRDVVASVIDGARKGSWLNSRKDDWVWKATMPDTQPERFAEHRAGMYMGHISGAKRAYDTHKGRKALVRYEDLLSDTLGTMRRVYTTLEIPFDDEELTRTVEKHSWSNIPEDQKGEGKFYRKAAPGSWKDDLTPEQARIVETMTASVIEEFYPA